MVLRCGILMFAGFFLEIINYVAVKKAIDNDPIWRTNISEKCGSDALKGAFETRSMIDNGDVAACFGCYFGLVFAAYKWPMMHRSVLKNETFWKPAARLLITLLMWIPSAFLFFYLKPSHIKNIYLLMLLKTLLPTFAMGFILFGVSDRVNLKLGLLELSESS